MVLALVPLAGGASAEPLPSVPMDSHVAMAPLRTAADTPNEGVKMLLSVPFCL